MKETVEQIKFEEADAFKKGVIYPLLVEEVKKMYAPDGLITLHLGVGSGIEVCHIPNGVIKQAILVDKNLEVLQVAQKKFANKNISVQSLANDVTEDLPIQLGSVDFVVALFLLNQVEHFQLVIDNVQKYLRSGGKFLIVVPNDQFIIFCSNFRPDRLSESVDDISERKIVKYIFSGVDLQTNLYVRPNSDYPDAMRMAGFGIEMNEDLYDPFDDSIGNIPKGYLLIGRKL